MGSCCSSSSALPSEYQSEARKLRAVLDSPNHQIPKVPRQGEVIPCQVYDVYDGDTVKVYFLFGQKAMNMSVRLVGIDAPEMKGSTPLETRAARLVRAEVIRAIGRGNHPLRIYKWDKFGGRVDADIYLDTALTQSISSHLLELKMVKQYHGRKKEPWTRSELEAICRLAKERGLQLGES